MHRVILLVMMITSYATKPVHNVVLTWQGNPVVSYQVYRVQNNPKKPVWNLKATTAGLTWTDSTVRAGNTYTYVVQDIAGKSNTVTVTIPSP